MQPIFRPINFTEKNLDTLIADSIGNPTTEKISQVLESYKNTKLHLIGYFIEENLIGIIGMEVLFIYPYEMKSCYTKFNLEKSKESVSRGAERILIREHPRSYKDNAANFSSSTSIQAIIRHISVLKTFRSQGIGKQLIVYIISHFALKKIIAETDDSAVDFYRALGFNCEIFEEKYNQRYNCILHLQ